MLYIQFYNLAIYRFDFFNKFSLLVYTKDNHSHRQKKSLCISICFVKQNVTLAVCSV